MMKIIGAGQRGSDVEGPFEGPAVTYIVEVSYNGSDWADLLADMRSWLDRRQIETEELTSSALARGIAVRVAFRDEDHAAVFASVFSGHLECTDADRDAARGTVARAAGDGANPLPSGDLASPDEWPTESAQPTRKAPPAGVSLMITRQQKADLRERGYSDNQIRDMKPEEAHRVLGLIERQPPSASLGRRRSPR
jgi:hypothetical protein